MRREESFRQGEASPKALGIDELFHPVADTMQEIEFFIGEPFRLQHFIGRILRTDEPVLLPSIIKLCPLQQFQKTPR